MKYNPKTHLLRPLEPGEIIEADDVRINVAEYHLEPPYRQSTGTAYNSAVNTPHFRPVPRTTGWRPRSEAHLIKEAADGSRIVYLYTNGQDYVCQKHHHGGDNFTHFYIIPPCDIPPPDPERERFERWWKLCAPENMNATDDKETAYCIWLAARKEAV